MCTLCPYACLCGLIGLVKCPDQVFAYKSGVAMEQFSGILALFVQGKAHTQAKLGIIFKQ
jgi:hypothetical protein